MADRKALMKDWPKNAQDVAGAETLLGHGYPTLAPVLPDIVQWTKASGPIVPLFCKFLAELGAPAIEPVRLALQGTHEEQILRLLRDVMRLGRRPRCSRLRTRSKRSCSARACTGCISLRSPCWFAPG